MKQHLVVIGHGPAGQAAAEVLRQWAGDAQITIISADQHRCFRPHLLPDFICGRVEEEDIFLRPYDFYERNNIKLRLGQPVSRLDLGKRRLLLAHNEMVDFDGLIIAVGGRPRVPEVYQPFSDEMLPLKTIAQAKVWIERLAEVDSVLIVGGDLTSLALTKALLHMGKRVSFVFTEEAFWPLRDTAEALDQAAARLEAKGVEVLPGRFRSLVRKGGGYSVLLDHSQVGAGLVGAFFGLVPAVRFLVGSGLAIERGILVDEHLNTGFPGVYATGDCAQVYSPQLKDYWVSIGYENALTLGRIAGANLGGSQISAHAAPETIFCDGGVKINTSWWAEF